MFVQQGSLMNGKVGGALGRGWGRLGGWPCVLVASLTVHVSCTCRV
jgi:hypothetical protein